MRPLLIRFLRPSGHRGGGRLRERQADPEGAALALDGVRADAAAHDVDHAPGDRQPEPEALLLARLAAPVEALEDALDLGRGNSRARVDHLQDDFPRAVMAAANGNATGG